MDPRCIVFTQKADIPPCLGKIFKLKTYRLLQDALVSKKKFKLALFKNAPPPPPMQNSLRFLSSPSRKSEITHFP